jgi:hypothetical protein
MPFLRGDVQVESLEQGWSYETDASAWAQNAQPLPDQQARGLVDIAFSTTLDEQPDPQVANPLEPPNDISEATPVTDDPYPATQGVIDSFGQVAPSGELGMGFMAVKMYYRNFPRQDGECSLVTDLCATKIM